MEVRDGERERERERANYNPYSVPVVSLDIVSLYASSNNAAEKLFAEMETKDGATYDAMIQGLVKVLGQQ